MINPLISIIIRTKNEERWISTCLTAVNKQTYKNIEIIIVDNNSTDKTIQKVNQFDNIKIVNCNEYIPGYALNIGIRESSGEFVVCLSGHCIPVNEYWLENLLRNFDDEKIAGVYGRQEPLSFTPDTDKRDLAIVFGLDKKIQKKDSFFHNANSMIRKDIWRKIPFDEKVTNIEDRIWAKKVLEEGYNTIYEPEASVYHYHGIHQDGNPERCSNVIKIIEHYTPGYINNYINDSNRSIISIIPMKGRSPIINEKPLLEYTIKSSLKSSYINKTYISTDSKENAEIGINKGCDVPFLRDTALSEDFVDLLQVYRYSLDKLEEKGIYPDILVLLEPTYPFRPDNLIDEMIAEFLKNGLDCLIAGKEESRPIIQKDENNFIIVSEGLTPRNLGTINYIGLKGVCSIVHADIIRRGEFYGKKNAIFTIHSEIVQFEVRNSTDLKIAEKLMIQE